MNIKQAALEDAVYLSKYYLENASHLNRWERTVEDGFHDISEWEHRFINGRWEDHVMTSLLNSANRNGRDK